MTVAVQESGDGALKRSASFAASGKIIENIVHFARALRHAGVPVTSGQVVGAAKAVEATGFSDKDDFFWTLHACFASKPEHGQIFAQTFRLFWRDPRYLEHMMSMLRPIVRGAQEERKAEAAAKRAAESLLQDAGAEAQELKHEDGDAVVNIDASATVSSQERLRDLDFEQMSSAEMAEAKRIISTLAMPVPPLASRRKRADPNGRYPDWRATMRAASGTGGEIRNVLRRRNRERWPNLIALCDISGSMSAYSRTLLHFMHSVSKRNGSAWAKSHVFTFGTRLTNITRHLSLSDPDAALDAAGSEAKDWEGGTRIGTCLRMFNVAWSRRVMGQGAIVLLITDGLEGEDPELLEKEMQRLRLSSLFLMWVNPLLRWESFAPKALGIRAMLPNVDCFRACHSIDSLEGLADAISRPFDSGERDRLMRVAELQ